MTCADFIAWFLCILSKYTPAVRYYYSLAVITLKGRTRQRGAPARPQRGVLFESEKGFQAKVSTSWLAPPIL